MTLIVTHDHGDFDGLAAAVAAAKLYPASVIFLPEPLHANVRAFVSLHRDLLPLTDLKQLPPPLSGRWWSIPEEKPPWSGPGACGRGRRSAPL